MKTVVANWKMNPETLEQAQELFNSIKKGINVKHTKVIILPPIIFLDKLKGLELGAQDCSWQEKGVLTGEISCEMLNNLDCKYVLLGHSQRRKELNETNQIINHKVKAVLDANLIPILFIGETLEQKEQGKTKQVLDFQLRSGLKDIYEFSELIVVYEPVWAISTGKGIEPEIQDIIQVKQFIQNILMEKFDSKENIQILYGGSVNKKNAVKFALETDGVVVGAKSLNGKEFINIVKSIDKVF